ncbi:ATP-binding cassette domain-containing protein [Granulicoccus phenolivorans]|uniref:ATP-binding cassette domain-containing protein n=1 Tax=Granulicoccus phenolivorans TaxID=266854 RepID=UPI0003FD356D|nr:ATP-binding cassette domain-containing protein [Granulicoccus phenolivorans]
MSDLGFAWPDGTIVFDGLSFVAGPVRSGLVGRNGTGKSTLLRLVAVELTPRSGSVTHTGRLGYLPQDLTLDTGLRVDQALGIAEIRAAIAAIEAGDADERHFTTIGDDWDVDERAEALLGRLGLGKLELDRRIGQTSGGEATLLGLAGLLLQRPDVLLLDEPTNNLDTRARARLSDIVDSFTGALLVVSHDRDLLRRMDQIGELRAGTLSWYGGNYDAYTAAVAAEQEAAEQAVRSAESDVRKQQRELIEARTKLDRRARYGKKMEANKREPKIIMGMRKRSQQESTGKHRQLHEDRLADARAALADAEALVHDDDTIRIDLPGTAVPTDRVVLRLSGVRLRTGQELDLAVHGPERIAVIGPNGIGKSTLLQTITGAVPPEAGTVQTLVPWRLLPQRLDLLDDDLSIIDNLARLTPTADNNTRRARLARFLFRGRDADQLVSTLSGGERFRASLAALLLAEPPPQLLLLDEPTNNLDLASLEQLTSALAAYEGALIVVSHDRTFLESLGITRWLDLAEQSDELSEESGQSDESELPDEAGQSGEPEPADQG